ncbi:MAG: redoxin domain-containing protein [Chloroflexi bacterium]|nr:redoxin domain-containing protein [Chloroflexota bacterium]
MRTKFFTLMTIFLLVGSTLPVSPVSAATTTVYAESGRFSLNIPADWITSGLPPIVKNQYFVGETILAADSAAAVEMSDDQVIVHGPLIGVTVTPLDAYRNYMTSDMTHYEIDGKTDRDLLKLYFEVQQPNTYPEFVEIDGYLAAQTPIFHPEMLGYWISDFGDSLVFESKVHQTVILADRLFYTITYTGPDLDRLAAMAATFRLYNTPPITERPPLEINEGAFSLGVDPGWLVMQWSWGRPMGPGYITLDSASREIYYAILPEMAGETLQTIYLRQNGSSTPSLDLPGLYIQIGIHPYDAVFGSADVLVDDTGLSNAFVKLATANHQFRDLEPIALTVNGAPALTAHVNSLYRGHNQGTFTVINSSYHLYSILIAGPEERWQSDYAPIAERLLASLEVIPPTPGEEMVVGTQVGLRAPDFTLPLISGEEVSLSDYRGKVVLLNFWGVWCGACVDEMPYLQEAHETRDDVVILAVDFGDSLTDLQAWIDEHDYTFPVVHDASGDVNARYGIWGYPTTLMIDRDGLIRSIRIQSATSIHEINIWIREAAQK